MFGIDIEERKRADRLLESMPDFFHHEFPLIEKNLSNQISWIV